MKFIKLILVATLLFCFNAYAEVIELDVKNAEHCLQQVKDAKDNFPVILVYAHHCPAWKMFQKTFDDFTQATPNRTFLRYDWDNAKFETAKTCLQLSGGLVSPIVMMVYKDQANSNEVFITMPIAAIGGTKAVWDEKVHKWVAESITAEEIQKTIFVPPSRQQSYLRTVSQ